MSLLCFHFEEMPLKCWTSVLAELIVKADCLEIHIMHDFFVLGWDKWRLVEK